jgi:hypothetical protein
MSRRSLIVLALTTLLAVPFLPVWPIEFKSQKEEMLPGYTVYPVYVRKFPFSSWNKVYVNPESPAEARWWIGCQAWFYPLIPYDPMFGWRSLDSIPLPMARC